MHTELVHGDMADQALVSGPLNLSSVFVSTYL